MYLGVKLLQNRPLKYVSYLQNKLKNQILNVNQQPGELYLSKMGQNALKFTKTESR